MIVLVAYVCQQNKKYLWPRTAKPAKSRWTPIQDSQFSTNGVLYHPLGFFTDYSSRMFISQFPANKINEIDLELCEKAKIRAPFCGC